MIDEYREPPDLSKAKISFDEAHFLDHWPWECRKFEYAKGGWRTHLKYAWRYKWSDRVNAATWCKVGRHRRAQMWQNHPDPAKRWTQTICGACGKPLGERQQA